ncbi:MAG TPA: bifunctional YncE family protein/alkaline phosphatase family protein [Chloroflexota bacterium]|nr:bifunctional YncE family protein/alkaline phosphatase family protein [Chloroflexota bacterium]
MKHRGAVLVLTAVMSLCVGGAFAEGAAPDPFGTNTVGPQAGQKVLLASNQWLNPAGTRVLTNNGGKMISSAVSPDGTKLAALTWYDFTGFLSIIDLGTGTIIQTVGAPHTGFLGDGSVAADGPLYSPDGKTLWLGQATDVVRFSVGLDGKVSNPIVINLPATGPGKGALPSGMALPSDGSKLYVALNGYNTLGVIDSTSNTLVNQIPVGVAPRQVVIVGNNAYVSNEGGIPTGNGNNHIYVNWSNDTPVVASNQTGAAITGTVSVVDLTKQAETKEIEVGLEPSAEYLASDGTLMVADSNSDSVSLIDTSTNTVVNSFKTDPISGTSVGSDPNAIMMPDSSHIVVSIGRDNALAIYSYMGPSMPIAYQGLIPTDAYPVAVSTDATSGQLVVTNDRGIGTWGPESTISKGQGTSPATGHNTYNDTSTITEFNWATELANIGAETQRVFTNNDWNNLPPASAVAKSHAKPAVVPAKVGLPSKIKHVFLIVRENRTYDQVFGDVAKGNGDAADAQFGARVTPNAHALANRFGLFDNYYDPSTLSADGHNWVLQADANDYIEKDFSSFWRSYPSEGADALAYQSNGNLFNQAEAAGKTVQDFGEYLQFSNVLAPTEPPWKQWYQDALVMEGKAPGPLPVPESLYTSWSDLLAVNKVVDPFFPTFDLQVPDQYRLDVWLQAFRKSEKTGILPNLTVMTLPDDHTGGPVTPEAQVADNDLALGRLVSAISHSKFWKTSAIFVEEDDAQNGVDHVDGHRAPAFVISPWSKPGAVNSNYYTQVNMTKTIEQILGLAPMNQMDRAAQPMFTAFNKKPDYRPYKFVPNQVPLTEGLPPSAGKALIAIPKAERAVYRQWTVWLQLQHLSGRGAVPDYAPPTQLNRYDWYSAHGWRLPYPGDKAILTPRQVGVPNYIWKLAQRQDIKPQTLGEASPDRRIGPPAGALPCLASSARSFKGGALVDDTISDTNDDLRRRRRDLTSGS